jgi:hypothetical protein
MSKLSPYINEFLSFIVMLLHNEAVKVSHFRLEDE